MKGDSFQLVGKTLAGTYEVQEVIGVGGMGTVYRANHNRLGKQLAVKVLSHASLEGDQMTRRFQREARIASDLGHPHIIQVHDYNETDNGDPFLVMELLSGRDLQQLLAEQNVLQPERAVFIMRQVCSALHAAHQLGIVHRDLKPGNIYLCDDQVHEDYVKVVDFGISKVLGSASVQTQDAALLGTPMYMSPEQADGDVKAIGPATDVFAAGSILYRMLCGQDAFAGEQPSIVLFQVVFKEPPAPRSVNPELPEALEEVLLRALAKDRNQRPGSMLELSRALLAAVPGSAGEVSGRWEEAEESTAGPAGPDQQPEDPDAAPTAPADEHPAGPSTTLGSVATEKVPRPGKVPVKGLGIALVLAVVVLGGLHLWRSGGSDEAPAGSPTEGASRPAATSRPLPGSPTPARKAAAPAALPGSQRSPDLRPLAVVAGVDARAGKASDAAPARPEGPGPNRRVKKTRPRRSRDTRNKKQPATKPAKKPGKDHLGEGIEADW